MGGKNSKEVAEQLGNDKRALEEQVKKFEEETFGDKLRVPLKHFFLKKKKFYIYESQSSKNFLDQIGKVAKDAVEGYQNGFSPNMIGDVTDLIGSIIGSSSGELSEESMYFVSKMGDGCIRTDLFISSKKIVIEGAKDSTTIAFCISMTISSIEVESLDKNEEKVIEAIQPPHIDENDPSKKSEVKTEA